MRDGGIRRAVVFPGQGTVGGEISGAARDALLDYTCDGDVPYQLSVFAGSVDLLYRLREAGIEPDVVAGHSLGEYGAAHAAGSLGLDDGVRLVAQRDRLMGAAARENPGGMVALIGADRDGVARATEEADGVVVAANFNTPRQIVISGQVDALEEVSQRVRGRKVRLEVSGAFHSPLMEGAAREMDELLREVDLEEPEIPMVGAADGALLTTAEEVREALRRQMLSPVRWVAVIGRLLDLGVREIFEAGEDGILTRMLRDFKREDVEGRTSREVLS
ncbi:MAG: ACP S-malonyltransferase [Actinomycetota bacterium]|nr:ACP S-malonyltransferase [Actinomycetota bacterium]